MDMSIRMIIQNHNMDSFLLESIEFFCILVYHIQGDIYRCIT